MATSRPPQGGSGSSDPQDYGKFERKIVEEVNKREAPTFIEGHPIPTNYEERSYFDVYELELGRVDGEPSLVIAGNDAQIALQASLLRAIDQLLTARGLGSFNFSVWAKEFENGFSSFQGSAELKKMRSKEVWPGVKNDNRPKIIECKPDKTLEIWDFRVVQLLPNREDKNEWYLFSGSTGILPGELSNGGIKKKGAGKCRR